MVLLRRVPLGLLVAPLLAGCFVNRPLAGPVPGAAPGTRLVIELTDVGRVALAPQIGPDVARVEGVLVQASDSQYQLGVTRVIGLWGAVQKWEGEQMTFRADHVRRMSERRFSLGRTLVAAGGVTAGFLAFVVTNSLLGGGNDAGGGPPGPPPNGN